MHIILCLVQRVPKRHSPPISDSIPVTRVEEPDQQTAPYKCTTATSHDQAQLGSVAFAP